MSLMACKTISSFFDAFIKELQDSKTAVQVLARIVIDTVNGGALIAYQRDNDGKKVVKDGKEVQLEHFPFGNELYIAVYEEYQKEHSEVFGRKTDEIKVIRWTCREASALAMESLSIAKWSEEASSYVWQFDDELPTNELYGRITKKITDPARLLRIAKQMTELAALLSVVKVPAAKAA